MFKENWGYMGRMLIQSPCAKRGEEGNFSSYLPNWQLLSCQASKRAAPDEQPPVLSLAQWECTESWGKEGFG